MKNNFAKNIKNIILLFIVFIYINNITYILILFVILEYLSDICLSSCPE